VSARIAKISRRDSIPADLVTQYAIVDPFAETPATDDVTRNTPPSALALNVGKAFRSRCRLALQFTAQF